ncbi:MAG: transcriptional regulator [Christensenellales bacterium]
MNIDEALRKRIMELVDQNDTTLTALCLESNLTPSTIFDFMVGKSKCPKVITIKKLCMGANIRLRDFFDRDYFDDIDDIL